MKEISRKDVTRAKSRAVTGSVEEISNAILSIMARCKGRENSITLGELYEELYGVLPDRDNLSDWWRLRFISQSINNIRRNSKCFIVASNTVSKGWHYYVPVNVSELRTYVTRGNKLINGIKAQRERAFTSVREGWYNEDWALGNTDIKKIGGGE